MKRHEFKSGAPDLPNICAFKTDRGMCGLPVSDEMHTPESAASTAQAGSASENLLPPRIWMVCGENGGIWAAFDTEAKATGYPGPRMFETAPRYVVGYTRDDLVSALRAALSSLSIRVNPKDSICAYCWCNTWDWTKHTDKCAAARAALTGHGGEGEKKNG